MTTIQPPPVIAINTEVYESIAIAPTPTSSAQKITAILLESDNRQSFIKLLGTPPPQSDSRDGSDKSIAKSSNPTQVIDIIDAMNEEPFTLETLDSLIKVHSEKKMSFILARVTTVDPDDNERFYHSYYAAHHINKVLFRTQPEEGLLHRMKAKNVSTVTNNISH